MCTITIPEAIMAQITMSGNGWNVAAEQPVPPGEYRVLSRNRILVVLQKKNGIPGDPTDTYYYVDRAEIDNQERPVR